ncbi:hypothetical protein AMTR_s00092p00114290 [Amborella trichopoda]|uniref:Uncharacterized protein n=1 Tax=Amborella trichopoda TaxID=13333 RepID=W1NUG1_AMBTC|nr:hypothetical protein AMTR_s00092p00114290 [Amborella trichopoda]
MAWGKSRDPLAAFDKLLPQLDLIVADDKTNFELRGDLTPYKKTVGNGGLVVRDTPKVRTPNPKTFGDSRDARELDNFLWQMERYFDVIYTRDERAKVHSHYEPHKHDHPVVAKKAC